MPSVTLNGNNRGFQMQINYTETYNQQTNTSEIKITSLKGKVSSSSFVLNCNVKGSITVNNQVIAKFDSTGKININGNTWVNISNATFSTITLPHNLDGSLVLSWHTANYGSYPSYGGTKSGIYVYQQYGGEYYNMTVLPATIATANATQGTVYALSVSAAEGTHVTVKRTSSPWGGSTGNIANGAAIYTGDVLLISFSTDAGYQIQTSTVNGTAFTSGNSKTASGDISIVITAMLAGIAYIDTGTEIIQALVYIDTGTAWLQCLIYADTGTAWQQCS